MNGDISIFDRMLEENRRQMDELVGDGTVSAGNDAPAEAKPVAGSRPHGSDIKPAGRPDDAAMTQETARALTSRLGSGWRYEIISEEHDGDQLVVSCKLIVDGKGTSATAKGSAPLRQSVAAGTPIAGRVGGVPFQYIAEGEGAQQALAGARHAALRQAVGEALMNCLKTI